MDLGALRALSLEVNMQAHGLDITVTKPAPDNTVPIDTRGIWLTTETEDVPTEHEFARREPIRLMAVTRDSVEGIPINTLIAAPEVFGGPVRTWRVDGLARREALHDRVWLVPYQE